QPRPLLLGVGDDHPGPARRMIRSRAPRGVPSEDGSGARRPMTDRRRQEAGLTALTVIALAVVVIAIAIWWSRRTDAAHRAKQLEDAEADARRWVERLGGQVLNLVGSNDAAKQALADAAERHTAAVSQLEQADTA